MPRAACVPASLGFTPSSIASSLATESKAARAAAESPCHEWAEPATKARLARAARLVSDPDESARMGAAGRAFVEQWASPAAVAAQYEDLFQELIDENRAH